jgi:hypothetical protein
MSDEAGTVKPEELRVAPTVRKWKRAAFPGDGSFPIFFDAPASTAAARLTEENGARDLPPSFPGPHDQQPSADAQPFFSISSSYATLRFESNRFAGPTAT